MSRRIPPCAWCAEPLARAPERVLHEYLALPGRPTIGWHLECAARDADYQRVAQIRGADGGPPGVGAELLRVVERRARSRVVAGTAYWRPA